jgi:hypothetical protein
MRIALVLALLTGCASPSVHEALPLGDDAESCGSCHADHAAQHGASGHARATSSPVFRAMLPEVEASWGAFARQQCEGCHAPAHSSDEAIGCVSCHAAIGNHGERDGLLAVDPTRPLGGRLDDAEPTVAHRTARRDFLASSSLCGTCHELTGPRLAVEPTLTEHRTSPQGRAGVSCADCHMPRDEARTLTPESTRVRATTDHRFIGFDPPWGASPDEARVAAERTRALLASALSLELTLVEGGVEVTLTNVGAGHAVPTGAAALRDLWVDLELDGEVIASRVIELGDRPMAGDRVVALLTDADRIERNVLDAGTSRRVRVPLLDVPPHAVVAKLRGRAIRDAVLARLGVDGRDVPTHEIHAANPN